MKNSIAIYGNVYQDTILTVPDFPIENRANQILHCQARSGGIHNVYRALSKLDDSRQNHLIPWQQSAATIIYNVSNSHRTSLVNKLKQTIVPEIIDADWHHICYIDDLDFDLMPLLKRIQPTAKISMDFCKRGEKSNYLALLQYADFVFCSTEDCVDNDLLRSRLNKNTLLVLHDKTGSRSFQANKMLFKYQIASVLENVNPLGAGDAFAAAFINSTLQGDMLEQAVAKAHHYATQSIMENNHE